MTVGLKGVQIMQVLPYFLFFIIMATKIRKKICLA